MKTQEELNALKEEVEALNEKLEELNKKLAELTEEELAQVTGGILSTQLSVSRIFEVDGAGIVNSKTSGKEVSERTALK